MITPTLPADIKELIVSELAEDKSALSSLLLTCSAFRRPAEKLLFRKVELDYEPAAKWITRRFNTAKLLDALKENEEIVSFIRDLSITFHTEAGGHWRDPDKKTLDDEDYEEPVPDPAFPRLLKLLRHAQIVGLTLRSMAFRLQCCHFDMSDFPATTLGLLLELRCRPTLRRLTLDSLCEMPGLLVTGNPATDRITSLNMVRFPLTIRQGARTLGSFNPADLPTSLRQIMEDKISMPFQWLEDLEMIDEPRYFPLFLCRTIPDNLELEKKLVTLPPKPDHETFSEVEYGTPDASFTFPSLKTVRLRVEYLRRDDVLVSPAIVEHAPSLNALILQGDFIMDDATDLEMLTVSHLISQCLKHPAPRELVFKSTKDCNTLNGTVGAITILLENMPNPANFVEKLTLELQWKDGDISHQESLKSVFDPHYQWLDFKNALKIFPTLQHLELRFSIIELYYAPGDEEQVLLAELLQELSKELSFGGKILVERSFSMREIESGCPVEAPYDYYF